LPEPDHPMRQFQALALGEQLAPVHLGESVQRRRQGLFALLVRCAFGPNFFLDRIELCDLCLADRASQLALVK
jgi:hypothetical protein